MTWIAILLQRQKKYRRNCGNCDRLFTQPYIPPPVIQEHEAALKKYKTAKATLQFPLDEALPTGLIQKLLKARMKKNQAKQKN